MNGKHRRVVAGIGSDGKSCVVLDDEVTPDMDPEIGSVVSLWAGRMGRVSNEAAIEDALVPFTLDKLSADQYFFQIAVFAPKLADDIIPMHFTNTTDHWYVAEGEIILVLQTGDVTLKAGDFGVCRGVMHSWRNDSKKPAKLITLLMPAKQLATYEGRMAGP